MCSGQLSLLPWRDWKCVVAYRYGVKTWFEQWYVCMLHRVPNTLQVNADSGWPHCAHCGLAKWQASQQHKAQVMQKDKRDENSNRGNSEVVDKFSGVGEQTLRSRGGGTVLSGGLRVLIVSGECKQETWFMLTNMYTNVGYIERLWTELRSGRRRLRFFTFRTQRRATSRSRDVITR